MYGNQIETHTRTKTKMDSLYRIVSHAYTCSHTWTIFGFNLVFYTFILQGLTIQFRFSSKNCLDSITRYESKLLLFLLVRRSPFSQLIQFYSMLLLLVVVVGCGWWAFVWLLVRLNWRGNGIASTVHNRYVVYHKRMQ